MRNAREKWLTERSSSVAICCNAILPERSESEPLTRALHLPWRETAAARFCGWLQPTIGLSDVSGEREHHVIYEKLVGLVGSTQSVLQRGADMSNDLVVMTDTWLVAELANARPARLPGNAVERRARQIEEERVKRLVDHIARVALEVVKICRTRANIRLGDTAALLPAFAIRIVSQFQADEIGIYRSQGAGNIRRRIVVADFGHRELGAVQRTRDQDRCLLRAKALPEAPSVNACLCHFNQPIRKGTPSLAFQTSVHYRRSPANGPAAAHNTKLSRQAVAGIALR
ncbi:hypothetical protein ACVWW7_001505 [Bradyrhizobium sp. LM6.9]